jgi:hypothetical protein
MLFCDLRTSEFIRSSWQGILLIIVNLYQAILDLHSSFLIQTGYLSVYLKLIPDHAYVI